MPTISKKITGEIVIPVETLSELQRDVKNVFTFKEKIEIATEERLSDVLDVILGGAICLGASDVHIEPKKEGTKIRVRVDGLLQDVLSIDVEIYKKLVSRIKLLARLKLNISDRPQDGRFSVIVPENINTDSKKTYMVEIRTSSLPTEYGETIVLRILNPKSLISLEALGLRKDLEDIFVKEIQKPNGMIIITGPTGSGKTTTLYAFLKKIQKPEIKIITIEDPIEYHLKGISQTQVSAKEVRSFGDSLSPRTTKKIYGFANGLRAIMRQDPDVILVGEIRDLETASIALQAALTGHLVFSTLHTNDAAGTIARLQALGEKAINIAPAINMSIAQRLVRRVCGCAKKEKVSVSNLEKIKKALSGLPKEVQHIKIDSEIQLAKPVGCKNCNSTGYRGRAGIYEALSVNEKIEQFILTSPSISALKKEAIKNGMVTMYQDGILKVLEGVTTIEEVERVVGEQ
jgi:type II secretory ATPase GspE/PulE/Tfp pilus assembly ATPase PilB-like protein